MSKFAGFERQYLTLDGKPLPLGKTLGHVLLEWIAAQPYPANDTEFIRDLIDTARKLTK